MVVLVPTPRWKVVMRRKALLPVVLACVSVLLLAGCFRISESFDGPDGALGFDQEWDEYRTFGEDPNPWYQVDQRSMRSNSLDLENSEVVAFAREVPPNGSQNVTVTVDALDMTMSQTGQEEHWVSVGALARGSAEAGPGGVARNFSAYNAELVYSNIVGVPSYFLVLWLADSWSYGDDPREVDILAAAPLGPTVEFPVEVTAKVVGPWITALAVQADSTMSYVTVEDYTLTEGRVGMISSLITPVDGEVVVDDFLAVMSDGTKEPGAIPFEELLEREGRSLRTAGVNRDEVPADLLVALAGRGRGE